MKNLETQVNKATLHEKDSKYTIRMVNAQFQKFTHSEVLKTYYDHDAREAREDFKRYNHMKAQSFKDLIIQHMNFIEQCIVEKACHEREILNRLKRLNEIKLQIQECKVQEVKESDASSGHTNSSGIVLDKGNQSLENQSSTSGNESSRSRNECIEKSTFRDDTYIIPSQDTEPVDEVNNNTTLDLSDMCNNEFKDDEKDDHEDECVVLANLIANLNLNIDENKKIQKQLRNANTTLTHELKTQSDSLKFVHELKQEMHADLKYIESLKKEIDKLESDKAEFSDMYDAILQECVSKDVMCSYLMSLPDLDALDELQCLYLHKVKECDCLAQKLSKQTESVTKKVHTELLQRFAKLEKHTISLEIALQKCKEQVKMTQFVMKKLQMPFETNVNNISKSKI
nr:hypothetical protein [Tanacetum cinerariifolium]